MDLNIFKDYATLSAQAAGDILESVKNKPPAVLCLAAGDTPRLTYELLAKRAVEESVDFSQCTFIALDEWVGIPPQNEGSCQYFLKTLLFDPLQISPGQTHLFDALSKDLAGECAKMNRAVAGKGGIDLMLVGVGMNGHIGFNEPGIPVAQYAHVVDLDATTQSVGQKYFTQPEVLKKGITLGLQHLLEARRVLLVASGAKKAEIIKKAIEGPIDTQVPASIIRQHPHGVVLLDEDAASLLTHPRA